MERTVEPVARSVAREHSAGAIGSVCRGRKAHDQQPGPRVTKTGDRPAPVGAIAKGTSFLPGDSLPVLDKPWASAAAHQIAAKDLQRVLVVDSPVHEEEG